MTAAQKAKARRKKRAEFDIAKKIRGFNKVIVEPFEIEPCKQFVEMNNTRKVDYPMMLQKYNIQNVQAWELHDFRKAMLKIVKKDNDDLFNEHLNKKSGRTSVKPTEQEGPKRFVHFVYLEPEEPIDRTSPQKVAPRGFYSISMQSDYVSALDGSADNSLRNHQVES